MEIKVGEYVRTIDGNIGKIEQINKEPTDDNVIYVVTDNWFGMYEEIVAHSKDIIDLIQEGDYVNGYKVDNIEDNKIIIGDTTQVIEQIIENEDIKSIVTKEQFRNMKYEV